LSTSGKLIVGPGIVAGVFNTAAEASGPLCVFSRNQVKFFGGSDVAPLGILVVVERVAVLVSAAQLDAIGNTLIESQAGVAGDLEVAASVDL
jgi:hypothetical protein